MGVPVERANLVAYSCKLLKTADFQDWCVNGLQVEGAARVRRIVMGVSRSQRLIMAAVERRAEMLIVHHGIFESALGKPPVFTGSLRDRLKLLLEHDINLLGFHLPLDAHPRFGNNISLCRLLGIKRTRAVDVGFIGELERAAALEDFSALCMVDAKAVLKDVSAQELVELEQRAGSSPAQEAALAVARERNPLASVEASFEQFLKQFDAEKTGPGLMVDDPFFSMSLGSGPSSGSSLADASGGPASPAGQGAAAPSMAA